MPLKTCRISNLRHCYTL